MDRHDMNYQDIAYDQVGAVARIWHNRPQARNAEGARMLDEFDHAFARAEADSSVRVIILGGKGDHFSAGHDLKEAQTERPNPTAEQRWEYEERRFYEYSLRIHDLKKPTIAQVQGACIAGGFMIANMCDLIVASDDAYFSDPVTHSLGTSSLEILVHPWVMGMRTAKEFLYTGRRMNADEAHRIGMVNRIVPRAQLEAATLELANTIAAAPPFGLRLLKRSLNRTWDMQGFKNAVSAHFDGHHLSHHTQEFKETMAKGLTNSIKAAKKVSD